MGNYDLINVDKEVERLTREIGTPEGNLRLRRWIELALEMEKDRDEMLVQVEALDEAVSAAEIFLARVKAAET